MSKVKISDYTDYLKEHKHLLQYYVTILEPRGVSLDVFAENVCFCESDVLVFKKGNIRRALQFRVNNLKRCKSRRSPPRDFDPFESYDMGDLLQPPSPESHDTHISHPVSSSSGHGRRAPPTAAAFQSSSQTNTRNMSTPRTNANAGPTMQPIRLYFNHPWYFFSVTLTDNVWTNRNRESICSAIVFAVQAACPQDAESISGRLLDNFRGIEITMPALPYTSSQQPAITNASIEQTGPLGRCEAWSKSYGVTVSHSNLHHLSLSGLKHSSPHFLACLVSH